MAAEKRRRYVPLDVNVAFGPFGIKLDKKWGMEGLCVWMLFLAAAKREPAQGTFTYTSEPEAWTKLGATATKFTFCEFITFCGRNKQTRKTCSGRVNYVEITGWKRWNDEFRTQSQTEQKSRKRAQSTADMLKTDAGHDAGHVVDTMRTEYEGEAESEYEGEVHATVTAGLDERRLPISIEKRLEIAKMLPHLHGRDTSTFGILERLAGNVSLASVCRVRESIQRSSRRVGVGYAVNALKSEAAEQASAA